MDAENEKRPLVIDLDIELEPPLSEEEIASVKPYTPGDYELSFLSPEQVKIALEALDELRSWQGKEPLPI